MVTSERTKSTRNFVTSHESSHFTVLTLETGEASKVSARNTLN